MIYDIIGIGAGIFNLGLASMLKESTDLKSLFLDKKNELCAKLINNNSEYKEKKFSLVILALGIETNISFRVSDVLEQFLLNSLNSDYSLVTDLSPMNKFFLQGMRKDAVGIHDPNISLAAYRNAKIVNSLCDKEIFTLDTHRDTFINW